MLARNKVLKCLTSVFLGKKYNHVAVYSDKPALICYGTNCALKSEGRLEGEMPLHVNIQICIWKDRNWENCDGW